MNIPLLGASPIDGTQARACVRSATTAVELAPQDKRYLVRLAALYQMFGQWRKSLPPAERALALSPDHVPAAILRAEALIRLRHRKEACATLDRALELNPEESSAHAGVGWALLRAGNHERAAEFFTEALRLFSGLSWAQEGALECAKHRYRVYRGIFGLKRWFNTQHAGMRVVLGLAGLVSAEERGGGFSLREPLC